MKNIAFTEKKNYKNLFRQNKSMFNSHVRFQRSFLFRFVGAMGTRELRFFSTFVIEMCFETRKMSVFFATILANIWFARFVWKKKGKRKQNKHYIKDLITHKKVVNVVCINRNSINFIFLRELSRFNN